MNKIDKVEIVANNFFTNDIDVDTFIEQMTTLIKETYKTGFMRGVERQMTAGNNPNNFTVKDNGEVVCNHCGHVVNSLNNDPTI